MVKVPRVPSWSRLQVLASRRVRRIAAAARYWAVDVAWRFSGHLGGWVCVAAYDAL